MKSTSEHSNENIVVNSESKPLYISHIIDNSDIISIQLPFIVRWGTIIFTFIIVILSVICWFIQYPDVITANGKLNSVNAPRTVITKVEGKLLTINVKENQFVHVGQTLGYMESIANPAEIVSLSEQVDSVDKLINNNQNQKILNFSTVITAKKHYSAGLGEIQPAYQVFVEDFIKFKDILPDGFLQRKKNMFMVDIKNIKRMSYILYEQQKLLQQDMSLTSKTFEANKLLAQSKVITSFDYRNEESKLLSKKLTLPQINASIVNNEGLLNAKKQEILELNNQLLERKYNFIQSIQTIKSQIKSWESKYLLKAPVSGAVNFAGFFQENQEIKYGQPLFYVQPSNSSYFVEINIPHYNFGKVALKQSVIIKFQAYPFEQYGSVIGEIEHIASIPANGGYLTRVRLPQGLLTNRSKVLHFQQGLVVQADIITVKMRLLERLYYDLYKQFEH
jgi:multidrug efflux pump subunit AcrA (membrane-fusion protein)